MPCVLLGLCAQLGQLSTAAFVVEVQKERGAGLPCWQFGKSWVSVVFFCLAAVESEPKIPSFFSVCCLTLKAPAVILHAIIGMDHVKF